MMIASSKEEFVPLIMEKYPLFISCESNGHYYLTTDSGHYDCLQLTMTSYRNMWNDILCDIGEEFDDSADIISVKLHTFYNYQGNDVILFRYYKDSNSIHSNILLDRMYLTKEFLRKIFDLGIDIHHNDGVQNNNIINLHRSWAIEKIIAYE